MSEEVNIEKLIYHKGTYLFAEVGESPIQVEIEGKFEYPKQIAQEVIHRFFH